MILLGGENNQYFLFVLLFLIECSKNKFILYIKNIFLSLIHLYSYNLFKKENQEIKRYDKNNCHLKSITTPVTALK